MLGSTYVVDVAKGANGALVVTTAPESPAPLTPGRYHMLHDAEMKMLVSRVVATEQALLLAKVKKQRGRQSPRRP